IVWQDSRNSPWDIYGATVSREGIVIGSFNVSIQSGKQIYPAITSGGDSVLVVYSGWCDSILGFPANTMRIWGKFLVPTVVIENRNLHYKTVGHKVLIYPNPFTNHCVIKFQSATQFGGPNHQTNPKLATCYSATQYGGLLATLNIYDVSGRVVKSFNPASSIQNQESIIWDGRDDFGRRVPAGVYFLVYQMGTSKASVKVVKLR
ncbi:MAG: T9SS type A sorting domain-containing protein, partial [candidate division WOR-3 bacterium]|nr:T9SS type A sorting domain-containing protein [candidate division WOR-3 bacterium]